MALLNRIRSFTSLAALATLTGAATLTSPAGACGGFFCSATPVDQTAERIIFSVNPNDTVTAYVQIQYAGERDAFAWIVPVPSDPELDVFPQRAFGALDVATQPQYFMNQCFRGDALAGAPSAAGSNNAAEDAAPPAVTVIDREQVGPFDTVTLQGDNAEVLITWLQDNGYRITTKMQPFIQQYVDDGLLFLAMKLLPDAQVSDIEPIAMTYQGSQPMIPIRLTTVAAQPEMGIKTWIFSSSRFAPDNYFDLEIDDASIQIDPFTGRNNYLTAVSRGVDQVGGQAFVTEFAQSTTALLQQFETQNVPPDAVAANDALVGLLRQFPYLTRLYTRMSAEEMNSDPRFKVAANQADVSNMHDLTPPNQDCNVIMDPPPPPPCAFTYCGRKGVCVQTVDGVDACACAAGDGSTARPTTTGVVPINTAAVAAPTGPIDVYCEPMEFNLSDPVEDMASTACTGFECGAHGECILMNGNPTCRCEEGYAATAQMTFDPATSTTRISMACSEVDGAVPELPLLPRIGQQEVTAEDIPAGTGTGTGTGTDTTGSGNNQTLSEGSGSSGGGCSVNQRGNSQGLGWLWAALGLSALALRRRR